MTKEIWILGIGGSHNGSICLLHGNKIAVAIQEERLVGAKHARVYAGRKSLGIRYCLDAAGISLEHLDRVVVASQRAIRHPENDHRLNPDLRGLTAPVDVVSHHLAHAASAYATSGFKHSAVLVVDGMGSPIEDLRSNDLAKVIDPVPSSSEHLSIYEAVAGCINPLEVHTTTRWIEKDPQGMWQFGSLGGMFAATAQQIFGNPNDAGKVMGLAPYGHPTFPVEDLVQYVNGRLLFPSVVPHTIRGTERWPARQQDYANLAASVQHALEVIMLQICARVRELTDARHLCLAGGVALNSVANQKLCAKTGFESIHIIPASCDSGVAVGAAYLGLWACGVLPPHPPTRIDFGGRSYRVGEVDTSIRTTPYVQAHPPTDLLGEVVDRLISGQIGAWFQGGSELGPRSLGNRSILCSPCRPNAKLHLNSRVKFRESFRPFAPSVLADRAEQWFEFGNTSTDSPFMLRVVPFHEQVCGRVPGVVHVDGTGRLQTVSRQDNPRFYDLIESFGQRTGIPILLNTSLNVRGEPVVETPEDALWCFLGTGLDFCVLNDTIVTKSPAFNSVLDLVPRIVALEYTLRLPVRDHALSNQLVGENAVSLKVSTPQGVHECTIPLKMVPVLSRIDGITSGRGIAAAIEAPEIDVQLTLLLLRRLHAIELSDESI
jgi:carbamoyltransferase